MILLSFDIEEFDVPLEHGVDLAMEEQIRISTAGTETILDILKAKGVKATFFCTANFALRSAAVVRRIVDEGHERSEEHTSELQSRQYLVCRLLLEKKKTSPIMSSYVSTCS